MISDVFPTGYFGAKLAGSAGATPSASWAPARWGSSRAQTAPQTNAQGDLWHPGWRPVDGPALGGA